MVKGAPGDAAGVKISGTDGPGPIGCGITDKTKLGRSQASWGAVR
jgi:hypothetical protein